MHLIVRGRKRDMPSPSSSPPTKYRSRTEIVIYILKVVRDYHHHNNTANNGATRMQLLYHTYLSFTSLKEYLELLVKNDLLEYDDAEKKFKITEKGLKLIDINGKMTGMISSKSFQKK